ncbi:MAG TPA: 5'/3'-nucleotidase SurE [Candidatus Cloacimonas sp.]|nr:5'/3'-nucleotidase SurE [Candidatus Cloacimonas sp.]MDD2250379.1 5'/3'-nucleotidase SurE [Candidatus Cloacimonadota bacterium]MCK9158699.1 5'/3'-nucleotidase SurE [Candidatus Cloacimonas sp.]MCK9165288.1 5'/3'-nucleotidase SurE [Candidatus Cloacimonas sp.]MDD3734435.1 5'/3'-nucleotidase SurE [Candidatus Cloacimonadota bacterium]
MKILLVNDDGILAPGIRALYKELKNAGHKITIVAPDSERSAASHSLSIRKELKVKKIADNEYAVSGTPVDCSIIALQKILAEPVDIIISGINAGQNMGEDVLYSGTVGAAMEAALLGNRAIAISITSYKNQRFDVAAHWMRKLLDLGIDKQAEEYGVLNINVPNLPIEEIKGIRLTRTGHRKYYNFVKVIKENDDGFVYEVGGDIPVWDNQTGSDAEAVNNGYISLTPLGFELTKSDTYPRILNWLEENKLLQLES